MARAAQAGADGGVVVAVGRGDHPRGGGSVPAGDAGAWPPTSRICVPRWRCWRQRCALRPGELAPRRGRRAEQPGVGRGVGVVGIAAPAERFAKTRRLAVLRTRLAAARGGVGGGSAVDHGGRETVVAHPQSPRRHRHDRTAVARPAGTRRGCFSPPMVSRASRAATKPSASTPTGRLRIKTPAALVERVRLACGDRRAGAVRSPRRRVGRAGQRRGARCATTSATTPPVAAGIWTRRGKPAPNRHPSSTELRGGPVLGVDLNADHLAGCVLDGSGNPIGDPTTIEVRHRGADGIAAGWAGARGASPRCSITPQRHQLRGDRGGKPRLRRRARHRPRNPGPRHSGGNGCAAPSPASPPDGSAPG